MGVSSSLYSGVSGLNANGNAMSVIGNNIANANTIGFKSSRAIFGDLLSSQISGSGGTSQVGRGVGLSIVDNIFSQGTFENTETNTDLAVEGAGFFMVSDPTTNNSVINYSRAGAFRFNSDGYLVNPEGFNVMGYALDANENTIGDLTPIWANTQSFTQSGPTSNITLNTNLDSDSSSIGGAEVTAAANTLNNLVPNAAYTALAADPRNATLVTAAETAANALLVSPRNEIYDLQTALSASPQVGADITAAANALNAVAADVAYTDLAADPTNAALQTAAVAAMDVLDADAVAIVDAVADLVAANASTSFDITDPSATSHYATSIQVYDSLGSTHLVTTYFSKDTNQSWEYNIVVDGAEVAGGTSGELELVGSGVLEFDDSGNLISIDGQDLYTVPGDTSSDPVANPPMATTFAGALDWVNGAAQDQQIEMDMQTTQYASPSVVVSQEQDGYGTGTLVKLSIDESGFVVGNFSNGTPRKLMQLALAKFTNPGALTKEGNNMFAESDGSGPPTVGTVGSGVGNIFTNALELSNVDLAQEFVKMITTQRGFSANSKTITTTDEMLAEVINLKR